MRVVVQKRLVDASSALLLSVLIALLLLGGTTFLTFTVAGANQTNQTALFFVNVSNQNNTLYLVQIVAPTIPIDLTPGNATIVTCNGSFQDLDGFQDLAVVSAVFYHESVGHDAPDDNNNHYTNSSCGACSEIPNSNGLNGTCSCNFPVQYYADNGTWRCNMTIDDGFFTDSNQSNPVEVTELLALEIENFSIDYGDLSVTEISPQQRNNVTNIGNIPINITLRGYGGTDESTGINHTMICASGTNITFDNHRFSLENGTDFGNMINLSNQTTQIPTLTLDRRTNDNALENSTNATYWKLRIPTGSSGVCNGTVIFGALSAR